MVPQGDVRQQGRGIVDLLNAKPHGLEEAVAMAVEAVGSVEKTKLRAKKGKALLQPSLEGRKETLRSSV